ncbi:condensation domain-containing protein [Catellatospora sichuanensis]|uniref:condensation domain-containing protein n=1 Tax=Catellatospora sichuanensis TaxID=1969805 RepID=UPI0011845EAE|nr:condensation domain-containing protein [Catellatospora sichuanensis]
MQVIPRRATPSGTAPLSLLQQRWWHLCTAYEGGASPIVVIADRITAPLDVPAFTAAVSALADRHDALRTTFAVGPDGPRQVIAPPGGLVTELLDVSGEADPPGRARELVAELARALLDLAGGRLVRSRLIRLGPADHVWCLAVHHILVDGESAMILQREAVALYRGEPLPEPFIGYADFAAWQCADTTGDVDLAWWTERLRGVPPLELPTDLPRPPAKTLRGGQVDVHVAAPVADALDRFARQRRATPYMVLATALLVVLARRSGQTDLCVGMPVSGRLLEETERTVGLFANTIALRVDLSGDPDLGELLGRVRAATIDGLARQAVPFGQVVAAVDPDADRSRTPVFQVTAALHTHTAAGPVDPHWRPFAQSAPQILHDLGVDAWREPDGLELTLRYDTGLFTADTAAALADEIVAVLRDLAEGATPAVFAVAARHG